MQFSKAVVFSFIISILLIQNVFPKSIETMEYTLNLIREGEENIQLGHDNILLLLGNTGSGKSTLAQLLTTDGKRLFSREVGTDTGEYIIEDFDDKISNNSTLVSQTIFPELLVEPISKAAYYDCPGFSDTRNSSIDISATYFIHKVIDAAKTIKNIFVVNYSSVKEGVDRADFLKLVRHAATFFKDFEKFQDGTSMIVTKVDNLYMKKGKELVLVSDEKILANIAQFLEKAKGSIHELIKEESDESKINVYKNAIKLIDVLLKKENDNYPRIGLFRRPDEPGSLDKVPLMQEVKKKILTLLGGLNYDPKVPEDFGYTISDESKNDITDLIESIGDHINGDVTKVGEDVKQSYYSVENNFADIYALKNYFRSIYDEISLMIKGMNSLSKPRQLVESLKSTLQKLKLPVNEQSLGRITRFDNFLDFLEAITNKELNMKPLEWIKAFEGSLKYLEDSRNIYTFLIDFYVKLSDWSVQRDPHIFNVNGLKAQVAEAQNKNTPITGNNIKSFLDEIYYEEIKQGYTIRGFDSIKNALFDERKFKIMYELLDIALYSPVEITCENNNKRVAKGDYVKMSAVLNSAVCPEKVLRNEVYAVNKIFIDQDLVEVGQQLKAMLMAPIWEIVDGRQINLIGDSGIPHGEPKAARGADGGSGAVEGVPGIRGVDGLPGLRGHPGGSVLGINNRMINGQNLVIKSTGGNGAPGQIGGDGGNGENGKDVGWTHTGSETKGSFWKKKKINYYTQFGGAGGVGADGAHGGKGGVPGIPSEIQILGLSEAVNSQLNPIVGQNGPDGAGGIHGIGGTSGNKCTGKTEKSVSVGVIEGGTGWSDVRCHRDKSADGVDGVTGAYTAGLEETEPAVILEGKKQSVEVFRSLLNTHVTNHYKVNYITQFLNVFNNHNDVNSLP